MMDQNELRELSILFEIGFLSDKVVKSILSFASGLLPINEEVLKEALTFLEMVKRARNNFPPKTIEEDTFIHLIIYRLALFAYSGVDGENFMVQISTMIEKLERLIVEKNTNDEALSNIVNFFSKTSKKTLEESSKFFEEFESCKEFVNAKKLIEFEMEKILLQNRLLSRLRSEEFPTDAQEKAINLLLKTSSMLYTKLVSLLEELESADKLPHEGREQLSQIIETTGERYNHITEIILKITKFIEASNIRNFPLGTFYTLENVINTFHKNVLLIVSVSGESSFSYMDLLVILKDLLKNALDKEEINKLEEDCPQCILLFNLPVFEKENVLLHCLIANPIGNYIIECYRLFQKIVKSEEFSKFLQFPQSINFPDFTENELDSVRIVEQTLGKIRNWITSISSDLLAIHTFGPSYLFAFFKHIFYTNTYKLSTPLKSRLKVMVEEIKQLNYTKNVQISKEIEKLEKYIEDETCYAKNEISDLIPKIKEEIRKLTTGKRYTLQIFEEEVPFLVSLILYLIPPNEILDFRNKTSRPARIISILNAGWLLTSTQINKVYQMLNAKTPEEKSQVDIKLNRLIQKSIELSEIHRKMGDVAK
nr:hypothetical protein [Candidatus Freyarchaeota archaeon]